MLPHDHSKGNTAGIPPPPRQHEQVPENSLVNIPPEYHTEFFEHSNTLAYFAPNQPPTVRPDPIQQPSQATRSQEDVFGELMSLAYLDPQQHESPSDQLRYPWGIPSYEDRPTTDLERIYIMQVVQQPQRARMCGFGDKDRRPITPPPILKLTVTDSEGFPLKPSELDISFLVVLCDVWAADASAKVNLVIHPTAAPMLTPSNSKAAAAAISTSSQSPPGVAGTRSNSESSTADNPTPAATRNLIGSLVASAAKLFDTNDQLGIYFVFQDLSIRTEGTFRLGFSLVDVGSPYMRSTNEASSRVLAQAFSEPFTVFSAKKFPGMIESTPLSRAFARQGVKIPIRKDASKSKKDDTAEEGDDE